MWTDTKDCVPLTDGNYLVQTVYGDVASMLYTTAGGWNTHIDQNGVLCDESAIEDGYVARWYDVPTPPEVPQAWYEEYRKGVIK